MNGTQVLSPPASYAYIPLDTPWYYSTSPSLLGSVLRDNHLSLATPILVYWGYSILFYIIDELNLLDRYRMHEPEEITKRNKATIHQVIKAVLAQQVVQTLVGWLVLDSREADVPQDLERLAASYGPSIGKAGIYWLYWYIFPSIRLFFSTFVIDTWQYTLHRAMHQSTYLYRNFHSVHHRLYVPYAFGALYNHPVEGFLLDTAGAAFASYMAGLSTREEILLFAISSFKTVDDHCGYKIPWDPFQIIWGNNAEYHDIHHQQFGIKKNFAQPFFTHWDRILGTRMTKEEAKSRYAKQMSEKSDQPLKEE